jgi:hypothetical protein
VYELIERPRSFDAAFYQTLKTYLKDDKPIVMGISVTKDFMQCSRKGLIRGVGCKASDFHVVLLLGVEEHRGVKECFHIQNSWGASWGDMGRGYLSKEYFENNFYGGYALSLPGFFKEA